MSASVVAFSLGSNLGRREENLAGALRALEAGILSGMRVSALYETEPVETDDVQPDYLNLCVVGESEFGPLELLERCQELERDAGRDPGGHRRPRTLDLDLLYHGESRAEGERLSLPHPGLARRRFVLAPLAELAPDWRHPADGRSVERMLADLGEEQPVRHCEHSEGWWRHESVR